MMPPDGTLARLKTQAQRWPRGNHYEDFDVGRRFVHHWGRTLHATDNLLFCTLTLHYNPHYTNAEFARAHDHVDTPVNPLLVFNTVFGLTVEDLSEGGGPFLGVDELSYLRVVYPGDTLYATSEVVARRLSLNRPGYGIVTWQTWGYDQHENTVICFKRSNLVKQRG